MALVVVIFFLFGVILGAIFGKVVRPYLMGLLGINTIPRMIMLDIFLCGVLLLINTGLYYLLIGD